jgi:ATP-dependent DNA helicase RecG
MKSSKSPTSEINLETSLSIFFSSKKPSPTLEKLNNAGILTCGDLLWTLPLRLTAMPPLQAFREAQPNQYLRASGKVIHAEVKPAFGRRGKGNILLYNGHVVLKDDLSQETMSLRWFNLYPNQKKQIEAIDHIIFLGQVQEYKAQKQIINPQLLSADIQAAEYIIEYPTINKVPGVQIKKLISALPRPFWSKIRSTLPELGYDQEISLGTAFKIMHGQYPLEDFSVELKQKAQDRLIYEEFLSNQLKILTRRKYIKKKAAPVFEIDPHTLKQVIIKLPFELTIDQEKVTSQIQEDFKSGHPMMRMIQGDVGCGKTVVAYLATQITRKNKFQVAIMCPTEALARQHFESFTQFDSSLNVELLLGSTKAKEKKDILTKLLEGAVDLVIGTHSLFQDSVQFKQLGLAIIDEQHKFGVEQRLKLISKGTGTHCLIMSATPIPRTLSLAQYGDLDISTIKSMPSGRKAIKTRITEKINYDKYISFVRSRLVLGEQAYFVFPAIEESETIDLANVKESLNTYQTIFKEFKVAALHGKMKPEEKEAVVSDFRNQKIHILISTSVIEVGINIPNATIMSIYGPERFGLSSIHQMRGRVGRGDKPGFCFLVLDKEIAPDSLERIKVIEDNLDGFIIAEADLRLRGEGDLFGVDQSGTASGVKLASYVTHGLVLERVIQDLKELEVTRPELLDPHFARLAKDQKILDTI